MNYITDYLIVALGGTLLHSLWQGLLIGVVLFSALRLIPKANAHLKYWMSITALVAMVVWTGWTFSKQWQTSSPATAVQLAPEQAIMPLTLSEATGSYSLEVKSFFDQLINNWIPYMPYIVTFWLVGAIILLFRLQGSMMYLSRMKTVGVTALNLSWQCKIKVMCQEMGIIRPVTLLESTLAKVPMVIGHLKPIILLPVGMVSGLSTAEIEAVLAHELAHVKRYDYLINIFQTLVESVLFFNPVVWWVSSQIRIQREHCCDDLAVKHCGNNLAYAQALTNLSTWTVPEGRLSMALFRDRKELFNRIKRLVGPHSRWSVRDRWAPALILTMGLLCLGWYSLKVQAQFKDQSPVQVPEPEVPTSTVVPPEPEVLEQWYDDETIAEPLVSPDTVPVPQEEPLPSMEPWVDAELDEDEDFYAGSFDWPMADLDLDLDVHLEVLEDLQLPPLEVFREIEENIVIPNFDDYHQNWFHLGGQLNDTTKKKIEAALQQQREALQKAMTEHSQALERARAQLQESLQQGRPEELTDEEWEMAKQQIRRAERTLERTLERTEHELEKALDQREFERQMEEVHRNLRESRRHMRDHAREMEEARRQHLREYRDHQRRWEMSPGRVQESALREMLFSDDLIDSRDADINLVFKKDLIKINGNKLEGELKEKYRRLFDDFYGSNSEGSLTFEEN